MSEKDKLLIKVERRKKQRKQMMHKNFVSYLCMTCMWKKMSALDIEPSANDSILLCNEGSLGPRSASKRDLNQRYIYSCEGKEEGEQAWSLLS